MSNIAYIWAPKFISPFKDGKVYLLPATRNQHCIDGYAFIVVCCTNTFNGLYRVPDKVYENAKVFINNKLPCFVIKMEDCEYVMPLEKIDDPKMLERIEIEQKKFKKYQKSSK